MDRHHVAHLDLDAAMVQQSLEEEQRHRQAEAEPSEPEGAEGDQEEEQENTPAEEEVGTSLIPVEKLLRGHETSHLQLRSRSRMTVPALKHHHRLSLKTSTLASPAPGADGSNPERDCHHFRSPSELWRSVAVLYCIISMPPTRRAAYLYMKCVGLASVRPADIITQGFSLAC